MDTPEAWPPGVAKQLGAYVYRLIDPRNGETFYVGKGKADRVFAHVRSDLQGDELDDKLNRIREIKLAGLEVGHVIHRHGMTPDVALEVEAALMDAYPGLTNVAGGIGNGDVGAMHASQIIRKYSAKQARFEHRALMINVNQSAAETDLYRATQYAWRISRRKAREAEVVLATRQGMIVGAFVPDEWLDATAENFPDRPPRPGRVGFKGRPAPTRIQRLYVDRRVPNEYRKRGAANPIRYTW